VDSGAIAFGILVYLAGAAVVLLAAIAAELRAQREGTPGGDHLSLATRLDGGGPRRRGGSSGGPRRRGGSGGGRQGPPGSGDAYGRIFRRRTMATVWLWLIRLGIPLRDRDDLRQEVFFEAYRRLPEYDPQFGSPVHWLFHVAQDVVQHHAARTAASREELTPSPPADEADPTPDAQTDLEREEARLSLLEALGALQAELRAVVVACDIDGLSMRAIAARCGIPVSAAHRRRSRAFSILRAWLTARDVT